MKTHVAKKIFTQKETSFYLRGINYKRCGYRYCVLHAKGPEYLQPMPATWHRQIINRRLENAPGLATGCKKQPVLSENQFVTAMRKTPTMAFW
jgi:hypothetical protein